MPALGAFDAPRTALPLTLRSSEQTTPADLFFAGRRLKQKLAIDGAHNVPRALFNRGPRLRRHLPRWTTWWIVSGDEASFRLSGHSCVAGVRLAGCFYMPIAPLYRNTGLWPSQKRGAFSWDGIGGVTASRRRPPESGFRYPVNLWRMLHDGERKV